MVKHAIAIKLQLMQPLGAGWWFAHQRGQLRRKKFRHWGLTRAGKFFWINSSHLLQVPRDQNQKSSSHSLHRRVDWNCEVRVRVLWLNVRSLSYCPGFEVQRLRSSVGKKRSTKSHEHARRKFSVA